MIHILILIVLLIIAVIIAPWLIGVAMAAAALYGVYVVIFAALMALALVVGAVWGIVSSMRNNKQEAAPITGGRVACKNCQAEVSDRLTHCDNCHARL